MIWIFTRDDPTPGLGGATGKDTGTRPHSGYNTSTTLLRVEPAEPTIRTSHGDLSLRQVAEALPGTGELMRSVGHTFAMSWHAAQGGNWDLAAYFLRRTRSLLRGLAVVRPKYADQVKEFDQDWLEPTYQAVVARDAAAFRREYEGSVEQANAYHVTTGHPYIRWRTPEAPPERGLDLGPGE